MRCGVYVIGSDGDKVWQHHAVSDQHQTKLRRQIENKNRNEEAVVRLEQIFYYYTSLGIPFEFRKMGRLQFMQFASHSSQYIVKSSPLMSDSKSSADEMQILFQEIFELLCSKDDSFLGPYVEYDIWRDIIEVVFRFLFLTKIQSDEKNKTSKLSVRSCNGFLTMHFNSNTSYSISTSLLLIGDWRKLSLFVANIYHVYY